MHQFPAFAYGGESEYIAVNFLVFFKNYKGVIPDLNQQFKLKSTGFTNLVISGSLIMIFLKVYYFLGSVPSITSSFGSI